MGLFEFMKDVRYRIRIFDNNLFLMSAEVPDKGQRFITATVHKASYGLGEKTKLTFQINPDIKPKIFTNKIMEIDFDIRDAVQLGDLLDLCPELVYEVNKNYKDKRKEKIETINAEFDVVDDQTIKDLTEPPAKKLQPDNPPEEKPNLTPEEEEEEDYRALDTLLRGMKEVKEIVGNAAPHLPIIGKFRKVPEDKKEQQIQKCLDLCQKHPKLLYWLPKHLNIEPEIHAIVMQSRIYRTGIQTSYYTAQTGAMIAEKILARPKESTGWQQVAIYGLVIVGIIATLGLIIWLFKG